MLAHMNTHQCVWIHAMFIFKSYPSQHKDLLPPKMTVWLKALTNRPFTKAHIFVLKTMQRHGNVSHRCPEAIPFLMLLNLELKSSRIKLVETSADLRCSHLCLMENAFAREISDISAGNRQFHQRKHPLIQNISSPSRMRVLKARFRILLQHWSCDSYSSLSSSLRHAGRACKSI